MSLLFDSEFHIISNQAEGYLIEDLHGLSLDELKQKLKETVNSKKFQEKVIEDVQLEKFRILRNIDRVKTLREELHERTAIEDDVLVERIRDYESQVKDEDGKVMGRLFVIRQLDCDLSVLTSVIAEVEANSCVTSDSDDTYEQVDISSQASVCARTPASSSRQTTSSFVTTKKRKSQSGHVEEVFKSASEN